MQCCRMEKDSSTGKWTVEWGSLGKHGVVPIASEVEARMLFGNKEGSGDREEEQRGVGYWSEYNRIKLLEAKEKAKEKGKEKEIGAEEVRGEKM